MSAKAKGKLSVVGLALMIFTSVYGFNNIPRAFFMVGYAAIPWYIIGGLFFFLPFALMVTEIGSAFKEEKGGIYSWMEKTIGPKAAFMGTFMWYGAYVIWMFATSSGIMVPLRSAFLDSFSMPSPFWMSIIGLIWLTLVTIVVLRGVDTIKVLTSIGGIAVLSLNVFLLLGSLLVLALNSFKPATAITLSAFTHSPAPGFDNSSIIGFVAFMVFAIFAYGGVEAVGGLVDETENPEKNFPKGVITAAIIIAIGYSLLIFMTGFFLDYHTGGAFFEGVKNGTINLGTAGYVVIQFLGQAMGQAFHMSTAGALMLGKIFKAFMGIAMLLTLMGAFFTLMYSPAKQLITGAPEKVWPGKLGHIDEKTGMPRVAMWVQLGIAATFIIINMVVSSINAGAQAVFFSIITNMMNVAMVLPYLFISVAYMKFKLNDDIEKPFVIFKSKAFGVIASAASILTVGFSIIFTVIQPIVDPAAASNLGGFGDAFTMILGPLVFGTIAFVLMTRFQNKYPEDYKALHELSADEVHHDK
jgi:amino acid transporter